MLRCAVREGTTAGSNARGRARARGRRFGLSENRTACLALRNPRAMAAPGDGSTKFARALASNSKAQRDAALDALARWLAAREVVEESDLLKVWKGMFYALWHADKAPVQVRSPSAAPPRRIPRHGSFA